MHGAYKTPGGKLVQVDFEVRDGRLTNVEVSGDFFLYPEEALEAITASLEGMEATLTPEERISRISQAIAPETEWLGSSPEALSIAIERALSDD
jgi:lipoate-protein ligase A